MIEIQEERERAKKERVEKREALLANLKKELEELLKTKDDLKEAHQKTKKLSTDATRKIQLQREVVIKEIGKKFEKITEKVKSQIENTEKEVTQSVQMIEKRISALQEMETSLKAAPEKDVAKELTKFQEMKSEVFLSVKTLKYVNFDVQPFLDEDLNNKLFGDLTTDSLPVQKINEQPLSADAAATKAQTQTGATLFGNLTTGSLLTKQEIKEKPFSADIGATKAQRQAETKTTPARGECMMVLSFLRTILLVCCVR